MRFGVERLLQASTFRSQAFIGVFFVKIDTWALSGDFESGPSSDFETSRDLRTI